MPQAGEIGDPSHIPRIIRRGHRESVFPSASTWTTTEAVVYRIDNVPLRQGKLYVLQTSLLNIVPSVVNDIGAVRIRWTESGTAGTSSTLLGQYRKKQTDTSNSDTTPINALFTVSADTTTASFAMTLARVAAGTSSTGVRLWGSSAEVVDMWIEEKGDDPGISGTAF